MNTYVPVRKIIKIVSTQRLSKRERHTSLQECLDSANETRRRRCRWKPWVLLFILSSVLVYVYSHRTHLFSTMNGQIFVSKIYYSLPPNGIDRKEYATNTKNPITHRKPITETETMEDYSKNDVFDSGLDLRAKHNDLPFCFRKRPYPQFTINMTSVNISKENVYPQVKKGGSYHPLECRARLRVGIIVPYRNREHNLGIFLYNIHPFLMEQKLDYQIFVIEQDGNELFNKGRVFNAGFREMMKFNTFHCVIFHDLDLLPLDENILYNCPTLPRHMCAQVNDTDIKREYNVTYTYKSLFGGVVAMTIEQFERANGFSNLYFGWGGEDNDIFWRLRAAGYPVVRYNRAVGVYFVLPHEREPANPYRHHLLSRAVERYKIDGLSNLEYYVVSTKFRHLCTHIVIEINPRDDNITELNLKWGKSFHKF